MIEAKTRQLKNTIKTDELPVGVYDLRWRREAWVHSWSKSTLDVIKTDVGIRTHNAIKAHVNPGKKKLSFWKVQMGKCKMPSLQSILIYVM